MARVARVFACALLLAGCAGLEPLPPTEPAPDLRGTWRGSWAGSPLTVTVIEQGEVSGRSAVNIGPVPVDALISGRREPSVAGVVTFAAAGRAVSTAVRGRVGHLHGRVALILESATPDGTQRLVLSQVAPDRLSGSGESSVPWEPSGPIDLTRVP